MIKKPILILIGLLTLEGSCFAMDRANVLFIAVDDLNDYVSPLDNHPGIKTPCLDRLAEAAVTFANAHCAAPACHPSRVSVMTGVHPVSSGIYRNSFGAHGPRWRHESPVLENAIVLSQHFRNHGYRAVGGGKIFHTLQWTPGDSQNDPDAWDDYRGDPLDPISADWPRPKLVPDSEAGLTPGLPPGRQTAFRRGTDHGAARGILWRPARGGLGDRTDEHEAGETALSRGGALPSAYSMGSSAALVRPVSE